MPILSCLPSPLAHTLRHILRISLVGSIYWISLISAAQTAAPVPATATTTTTATATAIHNAACCGPISAAGQRLADALDASGVDHLWLAHKHVDWETGEVNKPDSYRDTSRATHCSSFAAAMGKRLGVYMLRPPEHSPILLASAQTEWFANADGVRQGWQEINNAQEAQSRANNGDLVVISYASPNPQKPGHIAIVRPSLKTQRALDTQGPQIAQAGATNSPDTTAKQGFSHHPGAWPQAVRYFGHTLNASAPTADTH